MPSFIDSFRSWRRALKAKLPYVRRREYRVLQRNYAELIEAVDRFVTPAVQAQLHVVTPVQQGLSGDVCLFVSFADRRELKSHVVKHIEHLLDAGVQVILILNTDLPAHELVVDTPLLARLSGVLVRQNIDFDFGAWAHALSLCQGAEHWSRLFLVNDSIVGPLHRADFTRMIERIRGSGSDVVGLTEALSPQRHLQSYFLVFNAAALRNAEFQSLFGRILNWPSKSQVIDLYESRLTALMTAQGLRCEALFPSLSGDPLSSDDTSLRWAELVHAGFPYLKTRVIARYPNDPRIRSWLASPGVSGHVPS